MDSDCIALWASLRACTDIGHIADDKIRLVATLVQQVMTYATVRDIIEETYDKLRVKKYDFKLLQWAELRRIRDDQVSW